MKSNPDASVRKYMVPIMHIIEQRILHYDGLNDLKDAGDLKPMAAYTAFASEFATASTAPDWNIPNPVHEAVDQLNDLVEEDENGKEIWVW